MYNIFRKRYAAHKGNKILILVFSGVKMSISLDVSTLGHNKPDLWTVDDVPKNYKLEIWGLVYIFLLHPINKATGENNYR